MTRRKLKLWEALALSLGLMGPTLAMSGNGQGIIGTVGKAVPLVFLLGFLGVAFVAHGFIRLTQRYNHAGSAYALVGATLGPRPGFVAGFALYGTYLFFTICTAAIFGAFVNALLGVGGGDNPPFIGFGISALVCLLITAYLNTRDTSTVSRLLLLIEGIGIAGMVILVIVIFGQGGADATGLSPAFVAIGWVVIGLVIAVAAGKLAARIGASLRDELDAVDDGTAPMDASTNATS